MGQTHQREEAIFDAAMSEAETSLREGIAILREASEKDPSQEILLGSALHHLADVLRKRKNLDDSRAFAEEAVALYQRHSDWPTSEAVDAFRGLRAVLGDQRDFEQLDAVWPQQLQTMRARLPSDDPEFATELAYFVMRLLSREKLREAEPLARECLVIREKKVPDDWQTFNSRSLLGGSLLGQKKYADVEPLLLSGYEGMMQREDKIPPAGRPRLKETLQRLVQLYEATGRPDHVAKWKQKLAEFKEKEDQRRTAIAREAQSRDSASKPNRPPK